MVRFKCCPVFVLSSTLARCHLNYRAAIFVNNKKESVITPSFVILLNSGKRFFQNLIYVSIRCLKSINNGAEVISFKRSSAYQTAIDIRVCKKSCSIFCITAATIKDSGVFCNLFTIFISY